MGAYIPRHTGPLIWLPGSRAPEPAFQPVPMGQWWPPGTLQAWALVPCQHACLSVIPTGAWLRQGPFLEPQFPGLSTLGSAPSWALGVGRSCSQRVTAEAQSMNRAPLSSEGSVQGHPLRQGRVKAGEGEAAGSLRAPTQLGGPLRWGFTDWPPHGAMCPLRAPHGGGRLGFGCPEQS